MFATKKVSVVARKRSPRVCGMVSVQAAKWSTVAMALSVVIGMAVHPNVAKADLVGEWLFSGNANDSSGNGQNGTVNGATLTTDRFGNTDFAYDFVDDYIDIPSTMLPTNGGPISYSLWVNPRSNSGLDHRLIHHGGFTAGKAFNLYINDDSFMLDYFGNQKYTFDPTTQNEWQHVALVSDGTGHTFYLNGVETSSANKSLSILAGNPLTLGRHPGGGFFYDGKLDDFRVYDHALTESEVRQLAGIPEPSAIPLMIMGFTILFCRRRINSRV